MDKVNKYITYIPSTRQKKVQRESFNAFIHYGLNTFTGKEWGDGKVDPKVFNPSQQNTDQWIQSIKAGNFNGVILTCKHHDGFCLWPTQTTDYSVSSSPYKKGKGDIVREVSDSCKKFGLNFGVYLSPWDRNHKDYSTERYNDIYCQQITELLTNYGDIYCVWLDGACGAYMDGKPKQIYDFARYFDLIRQLQPLAVISNCGPDIRWVGNEGGFARESEWNVVPQFAYDIQTIEKNSQQSDDGRFVKKGSDVVFSDLGSRQFLDSYDDFMWYPAEVDVSIRRGWFYHESQDSKIRSLENLLRIYYTSVGGNSLYLLNIPPDTRGLIHKNDVNRLAEMGDYLRKAFAKPLAVKKITAPECEDKNFIKNVLEYSYDKNTFDTLSYYTPKKVADSYSIKLEFQKPTAINRVKIIENVAFSQRVEKFKIYANVNEKNVKIYDGSTIGYCRIAVFKKITTNNLTIIIEECRDKPYIEYIGVYEDDGYRLSKLKLVKTKRWFHQKFYKLFIAKENKNN